MGWFRRLRAASDGVLASSISFASAWRRKLTHSAARPFPARPASLGSRGGPEYSGKVTKTPFRNLRFLKISLRKPLALAYFSHPARGRKYKGRLLLRPLPLVVKNLFLLRLLVYMARLPGALGGAGAPRAPLQGGGQVAPSSGPAGHLPPRGKVRRHTGSFFVIARRAAGPTRQSVSPSKEKRIPTAPPGPRNDGAGARCAPLQTAGTPNSQFSILNSQFHSTFCIPAFCILSPLSTLNPR